MTDLGPHDAEARQLAVFFRELAARIERAPELAAAVRGALEESGLLAARQLEAPTSSRGKGARRSVAPVAAHGDQPAIDPFVVNRERGEAVLRETLGALDVASLRAIIRAHRLDPARISARWTAPDRLVGLIVQQVHARANVGRAFAQV